MRRRRTQFGIQIFPHQLDHADHSFGLFESNADSVPLVPRYFFDGDLQRTTQGGEGLAQRVQQFAKHSLILRSSGKWLRTCTHAVAPAGLSSYPTPRTVWIKGGENPSSTLRRR